LSVNVTVIINITPSTSDFLATGPDEDVPSVLPAEYQDEETGYLQGEDDNDVVAVFLSENEGHYYWANGHDTSRMKEHPNVSGILDLKFWLDSSVHHVITKRAARKINPKCP